MAGFVPPPPLGGVPGFVPATPPPPLGRIKGMGPPQFPAPLGGGKSNKVDPRDLRAMIEARAARAAAAPAPTAAATGPVLTKKEAENAAIRQWGLAYDKDKSIPALRGFNKAALAGAWAMMQVTQRRGAIADDDEDDWSPAPSPAPSPPPKAEEVAPPVAVAPPPVAVAPPPVAVKKAPPPVAVKKPRP